MYINRLAENFVQKSLSNKKILILLGARQVGKTTLLSRVVGGQKSIFLNFDLEVDKERFLAATKLTVEEGIKLLGTPDVLVIDEAQRLEGIGRMVKGWFDSGIKTKIILSGSSSLSLVDRTAEPLTGRNEKNFLPPLLFEEILDNQSWNASYRASPGHFSDQIRSLLAQVLIYGSYPETIVTSDKETYLLNLAGDYLFRDIFQLGGIKNVDVVKKLLLLLAYQTGSEVSVLELANNLKISRLTVEKYLGLLEDAFVVFHLGSFSSNLRKEISKSQKYYFWDTGVRNGIMNQFGMPEHRTDIGALWENWVIAEIAKKNTLFGNRNNLFFWRSRDGSEVDLIIEKGTDLQALEIKWSPSQKRVSKAFKNRYGILPKVVNQENFTNFVLELLNPLKK